MKKKKDLCKEEMVNNRAQEIQKEYYEKKGKEKRPDLFRAIVSSYYYRENLQEKGFPSLKKFFSKISKKFKEIEKEKEKAKEKSIPIFWGKFGQIELFPPQPAY